MASLEAVQNSVAHDAKNCWEIFQEVIVLFNDVENRRTISLDFQEEFEGFRVWCRSAGAFAEDHASLDYRLRDNAPTRKLIRTILQGLNSSLSQCTQIIVPKPVAEEAKVALSPRKAPSSESESSSEDTWQEPSLEDYLDDIVESIDKLVKITKAIRQASAYSGNSKAQAYEDVEQGPDGPVNKSQIFEQFIGDFLEKRYRQTDSNIRARLQRAISRCNRHFAYRRRYQQKLFYGTDEVMEARSNVLPAPKQAIVPTLSQPIHGDVPANVHSKRSEVRTYAPSSHMTASTLRPDFRPFDTKSSVISGSSFSRLSRKPSDDLPPAPPLEAGDRYFQCPYCCVLLPRNKSDPRAWRKHVISDLRPFVCIFSECSLAEPFFETKDDWLQHEQGQHNLEWYCDGLGTHLPVMFTSHESFKAHFTACHPGIFDSEEIEKLTGMSARPSATTFENCPFCDFQAVEQETCGEFQCSLQESKSSQCQLENHILDHLLALFIMALPERNDLPDLVSSDSSSRANIQSIQDSQTVDPDSEDPNYIDFEYFSSPLLDEDKVPDTTGDIWDSAIRGRLNSLQRLFNRLRKYLSELSDEITFLEGTLSELKDLLENFQFLLELWTRSLDDVNIYNSLSELRRWHPNIAGKSTATLEISYDESEYMVLGQLSEVLPTVENRLSYIRLGLLSCTESRQITDKVTNSVCKLSSTVYTLLLKKSQPSDGKNDQSPFETNEAAKKTFIRQLSSLDFLARQKEIFDGCLDTSQWLIESEEFRAWSSGRHWTLHIDGLPGVGKTALSSLVINHLKERFRHNDKIAVLCLYLDYKESDYQTKENLIASLLKQLIQQQISQFMSSNVQKAYQTAKESGHLGYNTIYETFSLEIETLERVYLVVDAIDEYSPTDLVASLKKISNKISLMTTGRELIENPIVSCNGCVRESLNMYFRCTRCTNFALCQSCWNAKVTCGNESHHYIEPYPSVRLHLQTNGPSITLYINNNLQAPLYVDNYPEAEMYSIEARVSTQRLGIGTFCKQDPKLISIISHTISQKANGNFLIAKLLWHTFKMKSSIEEVKDTVYSLKTKSSIEEVKDTLASFPKVLGNVYEDLIDSLDSQPQSNSGTVKRALSWIIYAYRPLTVKELHYAMGLGFHDHVFRILATTAPVNLIRFTVGLVNGVEYEPSARLIHRTAHEFFDQNRLKRFPNAAADIALTVIKCLATDALSESYSSKPAEESFLARDQKIRETLKKSPFHAYASEFWGYHAVEAQANVRVQTAILQLACSPSRLVSVMIAARYHSSRNRSKKVSIVDTNGLRVCSWFGIHTVIPELMKRGFDINEQDPEEGDTALIYACRNGHIATVATLLNYDPDVNVFSHRGNTALFEAIIWGKSPIVELLLTRGNDVDVNERGGSESREFTALMTAVLYGNEEIVQHLTKRDDIQVNLLSSDSETALLMAVKGQHTSIVASILRHPDTRTDPCDENGDSALMIASRKGYTDIVNLLLDDRVDPSMNKALAIAVERNQANIVKMLLDHGANHHTLNREDCHSLLSTAIRNKNGEILGLLLDQGMNVDAQDENRKTLLQEASLQNEPEITRLLLERSAAL